ncbi:hypothetical protein AAFF_G00174610 [Aldrovandia affinis]|uniref:F-box domain-containing protein n=1 Tax=Aldrovandia affinis TaxID=143900 RepID=A0AAD7W7I4_9TELE|nr:hypothetical protein AAFF_G00174610 [Aldrovandia affinis]
MNGITKGRFEVFSNSDEAPINKKLPKELLLRIFSYLDVVTLCRCAQVSKAWNVLALDGVTGRRSTCSTSRQTSRVAWWRTSLSDVGGSCASSV